MDLIRGWIEGFLRGRYGFEGQQAFWVLAVPVLIGAILVTTWLLLGLPTTSGPILPIPREASVGGSDYEAEPRYLPKPKTCSDYANEHEILIDEQAGKLTKSDLLWLDMDGDGRYCEGRNVVWKGDRAQ